MPYALLGDTRCSRGYPLTMMGLFSQARAKLPAHPTCEPLERTQRGRGREIPSGPGLNPARRGTPGSVRTAGRHQRGPTPSELALPAVGPTSYIQPLPRSPSCAYTRDGLLGITETLAADQQGKRTSAAYPLSETSRHVYTRYELSDSQGSKGTAVSEITPCVYTRDVVSDDGDAFSSRQMGKCVEIGSRCQYSHPMSTRGTHFLTRTRLRRVPPPQRVQRRQLVTKRTED